MSHKMAEKVVHLLKKIVKEVELLWLVGITENKTVYKYKNVLALCRKSQYIVLAVLLTLPFLFWQSFWELFRETTLREGFPLLVMELASFIVLGYVLGLKRLPANYISLAFIKTFMVLNRKWKPQAHEFQLKVLQDNVLLGRSSVLTYKPDIVAPPLQNLYLYVIWLLSISAIGKYTEIDVSRQENSALVSTTAVTSTAAILLMTTLSFETFPIVVEYHKSLCELWVLSAICVLAFLMLFLFQRFQRMVRGNMKPAHCTRMQWETIVFILTLYLMLTYIPVIHKGFSSKKVLAVKTEIMANTLVPKEVSNVFQASKRFTYPIFRAMAKMCSKVLR